jgi:hypothetical protein
MWEILLKRKSIRFHIKRAFFVKKIFRKYFALDIGTYYLYFNDGLVRYYVTLSRLYLPTNST